MKASIRYGEHASIDYAPEHAISTKGGQSLGVLVLSVCPILVLSNIHTSNSGLRYQLPMPMTSNLWQNRKRFAFHEVIDIA